MCSFCRSEWSSDVRSVLERTKRFVLSVLFARTEYAEQTGRDKGGDSPECDVPQASGAYSGERLLCENIRIEKI